MSSIQMRSWAGAFSTAMVMRARALLVLLHVAPAPQEVGEHGLSSGMTLLGQHEEVLHAALHVLAAVAAQIDPGELKLSVPVASVRCDPAAGVAGGPELVAHAGGRIARPGGADHGVIPQALVAEVNLLHVGVRVASTSPYFCCRSAKALRASVRDFLETSTATNPLVPEVDVDTGAAGSGEPCSAALATDGGGAPSGVFGMIRTLRGASGHAASGGLGRRRL